VIGFRSGHGYVSALFYVVFPYALFEDMPHAMNPTIAQGK
jgi:hypothetical protein